MQWQFPRAEPTPQQIREIQARCAEIGVRFLFENLSYKFAKESYKQESEILRGANILIGMLDGYVDDVRQESTTLRMGTRWNKEMQKFTSSEEDKKEDLRLKYEMQETSNVRMVRVCLPARASPAGRWRRRQCSVYRTC